jgi:hypothetical protein
MQVLAIGKWSKADKRWKMLVALHRPANSPPAAPAPAGHRTSSRPTPLKRPSK